MNSYETKKMALENLKKALSDIRAKCASEFIKTCFLEYPMRQRQVNNIKKDIDKLVIKTKEALTKKLDDNVLLSLINETHEKCKQVSDLLSFFDKPDS